MRSFYCNKEEKTGFYLRYLTKNIIFATNQSKAKLMKELIPIIVVAALCLAMVLYRYHQKKNLRYHINSLQKAVDKIFSDTKEEGLTHTNFMVGLIHYYDCSRKEAYYLLGYAQKHGIIKVDDQMIMKV